MEHLLSPVFHTLPFAEAFFGTIFPIPMVKSINLFHLPTAMSALEHS